ncbi:MAG: acyl-CoA thioesterase [Planctomycetota bacterium]|nr:acyl-CoA thioesterase [Planctomycetota bacterium]
MTITRFEVIRTPPMPHTDWPAPADISFWTKVVVGDEGMSRAVPHVNNAEYVRWIDRLAELATDAAGFTREWHLEQGTMWFVARHEIDYRGETFASDELLAATWLHAFTRTSVRRDTLIVRPSDDRVICIANTRWALVDLKTRRPIRIPGEIKAAFPPAHSTAIGETATARRSDS